MIRRVRVGNVLKLQRRAVSIDPLKSYRLIGVYSFGKGIFHREPTPGPELGNYRFFAIEPGDLVLSNIQAWEGAIAHATSDDAGTVGTHRFLTYVAATDEIDTSWARYFFLSRAGFPLIMQAAPGTVKRNRTLAIDRFEELEIPLPPLDRQRRIAAKLDLVGSAMRQISTLAERRQRIQDALVPAFAQRRDLGDDAKYSAGWRRGQLGDVMTPASDTHPVEAHLN